MSSGPEMLFISGIMIVAGAVLVIMYNTDLLLRLILLAAGGSPRFAPVLRMAIAYPLSNRFRTGMTIAIFAIVMFSVIFMATMFKVNDIVLDDTEQFTGGFDLRVSSSSSNPVDDLPRAIATQPGLRRADYDVIASQVSLPVELRQGESGRWASYLIQAVDEAYLENIDYDLSVKAEGYETADEIWEAVREHRGYAVADRYAVPSRSTTSIIIGGPDFKLEGVYLEDETMQPIRVSVREPNTGATFELTIIGVLEQSALTGFGLVTSQETLEKALPFELPDADLLHPPGGGRRGGPGRRGAGKRFPEERPGERRPDPGAAGCAFHAVCVPVPAAGLPDGGPGGGRGCPGGDQHPGGGRAAPADRHAARPGVPAQDGELDLPDRIVLCGAAGHRPGRRPGIDPGVPDDHGYGCRDPRADLPGALDGDHRRVRPGLCHVAADHLAARRPGFADHPGGGAAVRVEAGRNGCVARQRVWTLSPRPPSPKGGRGSSLIRGVLAARCQNSPMVAKDPGKGEEFLWL